MIRAFRRGLIALTFVTCFSPSLVAQQPAASDFQPPCRGDVWWTDSDATFADFDFWIGEWQIYDRKTGELLGFDQVDKAHEGCAIRQAWRQLNDRFTTPGAPWRYAGGSFTALAADGRWRQNWLDNAGGNILLFGGLGDDGVMTLESEWMAFTTRQGQNVRLKYQWHWRPADDGSIHNWGFIKQGLADAEEPDWQPYFDIEYRRNAPGGPAAQRIPPSVDDPS